MMNRCTVPIAGLAIVLFCVACDDTVPTENSGLFAEVTGDEVSLRIDPVSFASEITFLERGSEVQVIGRTDERVKIGNLNEFWYRIRMPDGIEGWVYGSNLSIGSAGTAASASSTERFQKEFGLSHVGKWWEVRADGSTGYARVYFWPDGVYKYALGRGDMAEGKYEIDFEERVIRLDKGSPAGETLTIKRLGPEYRLYGARNDRPVILRRAFIDPDAPDPGEEEEGNDTGTAPTQSEETAPTGSDVTAPAQSADGE
ncbi:MAG: SH3 domain-containing protein [Leptospiraceae bacterium]|nr:SH3 domain-containing protein [Leptospiraceae bacterium]